MVRYFGVEKKMGKRSLNIELQFILFYAYLCGDKCVEQTNDKDYLQSLSLDGNWNRNAKNSTNTQETLQNTNPTINTNIKKKLNQKTERDKTQKKTIKKLTR